MKKFALFAGMMSLLLSSCTTIQITTIPEGATVRLADSETVAAPCDVRLWLFSRKKATVSHRGFADQSCDLTWSSSRSLQVILNHELRIASRPEGAEVTVNGEPAGMTPCKITLPATVLSADVSIALQGYQTKSFKYDVTRNTGVINVMLSKDGPGRRMPCVSYDASGFPIFKEDIIKGELDGASNDNAEVVAFMDAARFPLYLRSFESADKLLLTVTEPRNNRRLRSILLYKLDCLDGTMTQVLSGHYFELNGVVSKNFLYYSSFQTGRFDLWKKDISSPDAVPILLLTNTLIKTELDVAKDGAYILFTAYAPSKPDEPHIWLFVPVSTTSSEMHAISEGTYPAWSPDAKHFLFQKQHLRETVQGNQPEAKLEKTAPERIAKADMDGSNIRILNDFIGKHRDIHPAWSPDGKFIAFASNRGNDSPDDFDIWVMDSNGEHPRQITDSACRDDSPVFSPDGKTIFFRSNRNLTWGIWKIRLED